MGYWLSRVDISGKQNYIFSSNKLKEIVGASEIIRFTTEELGKKIIKELGYSTEFFSKNNNDGCILFEAGGNSCYIFTNKKKALKFNSTFSRFVLEKFNGLDLNIALFEFDIYKDNIIEILDILDKKVEYKKRSKSSFSNRVSYGCIRECSNTGKPAGYINKDDEMKKVSKESFDKLSFYNLNIKEYGIENNWSKLKPIDSNLEFTKDLDAIGGIKGEGRYLGITCIDGNKMGDKVKKFKEKYKTIVGEKSNFEYISDYRNFSNRIQVMYENAFKNTIEILTEKYDNYASKIYSNSDVKIIPLRPLIFAGDDITFISNGQLSVEIANCFLSSLESDKEYTACCGLSIVKLKTPFSKGVQIAEELQKKAKKVFYQLNDNFTSVVEWRVFRGDLALNENHEFDGKRSFLIKGNKSQTVTEHYSYIHFKKVMKELKEESFKTKIRQYFRNLNISRADAKLFLYKYQMEVKDDDQNGKMSYDELYDLFYYGIEMLDMFLPLEEVN